jgi:beta-galactosidase/beta-glucuronidase
MLDACDRLGMLVMDETFDMWTEPKTDHDDALRFTDPYLAVRPPSHHGRDVTHASPWAFSDVVPS